MSLWILFDPFLVYAAWEGNEAKYILNIRFSQRHDSQNAELKAKLF